MGERDQQQVEDEYNYRKITINVLSMITTTKIGDP